MRGYIRKRERKTGTKYQYIVDVGRNPISGKREQASKTFSTKKECEKAMNALIAKVEAGTYFELSNITLEEYMDKWLSDYAEAHVAPKTYERYKEIVNKYIVPFMGNATLSKIKPLHIQDFYNHCLKELGNSSTTVRQYHAVLNKAFNQAIKWQIININPCIAVDAPKKAKTEMLVLDELQLEKLLTRVEKMTIYNYAAIAAHTGMRLGEICGLTWDDIDLNKGTIHLTSQLQKIKGEILRLPLKTDKSKRKIVLNDFLLNLFKAIHKSQFNNVIPLRPRDNYVLTKEDGLPYDPGYISRNFRRIMKDYGKEKKGIAYELAIPSIRFHDLRHTHATLLLKAGVHPKIVAERLGHSNITMTLNTYSHVLPDMQEEAMKKFDNLLSNRA